MRKILTALFLLILVFLLITSYDRDMELAAIGYEPETEEVEVVSVSEPKLKVEYEPAPIVTRSEPVAPIAEEPVVEEVNYDKTFRVTAYCACEKCCGVWATKRPLDETGNPIVYGASGDVLETKVSCASPLAFGTEIELKDYGTVVVQDRTADWVVDKHGEYIIDIYMDNHEEARNWGLQYIEGKIVN